jgi:hypothetical protein
MVDGKNLETLNAISLCRAPILRASQNEIERKSCERKSAQSKTGQSGADGEDMAVRAMSQLQSHEIRRVVENAGCRLNPAIYVAIQVSWLVARAVATPASETCPT